MNLTGKNFIGGELSAKGNKIFNAVNPVTGEKMQPDFFEAAQEEIDSAVQKAETTFKQYRKKSGRQRAEFLEAIADEILELGDDLVKRCCEETALPEARMTGERGRTVNQLKLFAALLKEGSWVDARIETADPERRPVPKPDIRSMQQALGPVGIFGASNFPLAFSVAGGDTASALAAGCTIVVKAHPAHPGTCELIAVAIEKAAKKTNMPNGTFSMVHGQSNAVGMAIVNHPLIKAIGFTGSFRGGKAIFDAAASRPEPVPVYAEMGSINPVFILPGVLRQRKDEIAKGLLASVTLGVGQFCTNPGLIILEKSNDTEKFLKIAAENFKSAPAATMLTSGIHQAYEKQFETAGSQKGVSLLAHGKPNGSNCQGIPGLLQTTGETFLSNPKLEEEIFGPATLAVTADDKTELMKIAENLKGHLTATLHATDDDLENYSDLIAVLERKAGRLIINGFPTGVEVCHSMVHGGPFPATTASRSTSVGTAAIYRFTRPVCYQDFPNNKLPDELKDENPLDIWRLINGKRRQ